MAEVNGDEKVNDHVNGHEEEPVNGDVEVAQDVQDAPEEREAPPSPITIKVPTPSNTRTTPKTTPRTLSLIPQPHETLQELKLAVTESISGYWLGPYSLRLPITGKTRPERPKLGVLEGGEIIVKEGERLSDWLEVGDVFWGFEDGEERILEVVREPYSEFSARQTVLRLLELISPPGSSTALTTSLALNPGATIFESLQGSPFPDTLAYTEINGKKGKETVQARKPGHAFSDWVDWETSAAPSGLGGLPMGLDALVVEKCLKGVILSGFNPPTPNLRAKGHQLYLQVTTLEGDIITLICATTGWYPSKSTSSHFDPSPRPNTTPNHSLIDTLHTLSPLFSQNLATIPPLNPNQKIEPISTVPIPQAEPAYPFLVPAPSNQNNEILRSQLAYLHTGATGPDGLDGARDWNEEIQGVRELPKGTMQERVLREKMAQKTWAEFEAAAVRAIVAVSRGDIPPLNPNEPSHSHMYLLSNIFITKALDSIHSYSHLGGDAAAHVCHGKDAEGVKVINKLDVDGLGVLGHVVVDWAGGRWVGQSVLPGIFSRRLAEEEEKTAEGGLEKKDKEDWVKVEENGSPTKSIGSEENAEVEAEGEKEEQLDNPLIIYGLDSESQNLIHYDAHTHRLFSKIAETLRLAPHTVQDGKKAAWEFYASCEVKGLRGSDGRRYLLDLIRLSGVDVRWLEDDVEGKEGAVKYPHRVVLLRQELVEVFWESELKRWARGVAAERAKVAGTNGDTESKEKADGEAEAVKTEAEGGVKEGEESVKVNGDEDKTSSETKPEGEKPVTDPLPEIDASQFKLLFNPDAFVDQPQPKSTSDTKPSTKYLPSTQTSLDDPSIKAVRDASSFLREVAVPGLVLDVLTGNQGGIVDGGSLSKVMHGRGINVRYLGKIMEKVEEFSTKGDEEGEGEEVFLGHLAAFKGIVLQEMVLRASKHIIRRLLSQLHQDDMTSAISHYLNCLLGTSLNSNPTPSTPTIPDDLFTTPSTKSSNPDPEYTTLTPESLRTSIISEVSRRFRWTLSDEFFVDGLRKKQLMRELGVRLGWQLLKRDYAFEKRMQGGGDEGRELSKKEKKKAVNGNGSGKGDVKSLEGETTFTKEDVLCLVPIVKGTAPSSSIAEELFEAGRSHLSTSPSPTSNSLSLSLLLESVQLSESIHAVLHPSVSESYTTYSSILHQLARLKLQHLAANPNPNSDPNDLDLDVETALRLQKQACVISERTRGIWSEETMGCYVQLGMLEGLGGQGEEGLRWFRHVLRIWEVVHGKGHPEINTVLNNAAILLQSLSDYPASLKLLLESHASTLAIFGPNSLQTAQSKHQLTQAYFLVGNVKEALVCAEDAWRVFKLRLGETHGQSVECGKGVELLRGVVERGLLPVDGQAQGQAQVQGEEQIEAARRLTPASGSGSTSARFAGLRSKLTTINASGSGIKVVEPKVDTSRIGERGHLEVDELVKFIQGGGGGGAKTTGGKKSVRGKKRGGK